MVDLIINGTTTTLYGIQNYGNVEVRNGGILYVTPYNGILDTGILEIHANNILVDATSQIIADVRGFRGMQGTAGPGEGPGAGTGGGFSGSGAGYGGSGGAGYYTSGPAYGTESGMDIERGSGGGCGVYFGSYGKGGNGGGLVALYTNTITINGIISSNGENGTTGAGQHGSGGGSGGGILIGGTSVTISGTLRANGGNGSNVSGSPRWGGGGGGGGRIKIFYGTLNTTGSTITANGSPGGSGNGAPSGQAGVNGTIYSVSSLPVPTCVSTLKYEGDTVHLSATPKDGIGPYYVEFIKSISGVNTTISSLSGMVENTEVTYDHVLTNEDIRTALTGTIDFSVYIEDSCPTGSMPCTQTCTITIGCLAPICNFQVT